MLDKKDAYFFEFHKTLDSVYSTWYVEGAGVSTSSVKEISHDNEQLLLEKKVMSADDPTSLQRMVTFYIGINCCLKGEQEQRDLSAEQFEHSPSGGYDHNSFNKYIHFKE